MSGFVLFLLVLQLVSSINAYKQDDVYPQPTYAEPIDYSKFVVPKYGSAASAGRPPKEIEHVDFPGSTIYITGGSKKVPESFPYYSNNLTGVSAEKSLYAYDLNTIAFLRKEWAELPRARFQHIQITHADQLWLWGGNNVVEFDRFNLETEEWDVLPPFGAYPEPTYGAASVVVGDILYIFGGVEAASGITNGEFWAYNLISGAWTELSQVPSARAGATLTYSDFSGKDTLYLAFGQGTNKQRLDDFWSYEIETDSWTLRASGPPGRWGHGAFERQGFVYISLGYGVDTDDIWGYDIEFDDWHYHIRQDNDITPAAKLGFSNVWIPEISYLFIFAGATDHQDYIPSLPDVWDRETPIFGDVWYVGGGEWNRQLCYPGYKWVFPACVPDVSFCTDCKDCDSIDLIRRTYVQEIEDNLITKEYKGFLRQCPAFWRRKIYRYAKWFSLYASE